MARRMVNKTIHARKMMRAGTRVETKDESEADSPVAELTFSSSLAFWRRTWCRTLRVDMAAVGIASQGSSTDAVNVVVASWTEAQETTETATSASR